MNNRLIKLLQNCKIADVPQIDQNISKVQILKKTAFEFQVGQCYKILINQKKLVDYDIKINYNLTELDVELVDINQSFIKVFSPIWEGWLPINCVQIIKQL